MTRESPASTRTKRLVSAAAVAAGLSVVGARVLDGQSPIISEASIRGHMEFLASDAMQGRGSGTRDEELAATYMGAQMRRWGIEPLGDNGGYVQQIATTRPTPQSPPELTVQGQMFRTGPDINISSFNTAVPAGPLYKLEAGKAAPSGAFVLMPAGVAGPVADTSAAAGVLIEQAPPATGGGRTGGAAGGRGRAGGADPRLLVCGGTKSQAAAAAANAANAGAAGNAGAGGGRRGGGGAGGGRGVGGATPQWRITLSPQTFARLSAMPDGAPVSVFADLKSLTWNALGRLKGSDPAMADDVVLLSAHLDHLGVRGVAEDSIFNGADDDASGSTAVLALAEAIAKGPRPKRTVMFAWFGSEESGGAGARHFLDQPPVPLKQIVANLEFEMIGRADPLVPEHSLWLTGYECSDLGDTLASRGARIVQDPRPDQSFFTRSDNIQLARQGIVAQTVSSFNLHPDYHRASDEIRLIDFAHMTESIQSIVKPVLWLANSKFRPRWRDGMCPLPCGSGSP